MMTAGAWQVRVIVSGDRGEGMLSVPVPTLPQATLDMRPALARCCSYSCCCWRRASWRWSRRWRARPGSTQGRRSILALDAAGGSPPRSRRRCRRGRLSRQPVVDGRGLGLRALCLQAAEATAAVRRTRALRLTLRDPGWIVNRRLDDFVPDHGHPMHLFVVSPALDRLWHLHPARARPRRSNTSCRICRPAIRALRGSGPRHRRVRDRHKASPYRRSANKAGSEA